LYSTKKLTALGVATISLFAASQAMAGSMVVRSSGPSAKAYPTGKALPSDSKLSLKPGDMITVLDSGGTRVLKGPGVVAVSGSAAASGTGFAQLLANTGARQSRTGATRSAIGGGLARSPNVWYVDATKNGNQCVTDPASLALWRPDNSKAGNISISSLNDGKSVTLDYRPGQDVRPWPVADMPVTEGAQFKITMADGKTPSTIKVVLSNAAPEGLDGVAASLLAKGCSNQMDVLVEGSMQANEIASAR
jgi:hypothetical protein